jgi:dCTP deaminase
MNPVGHGILTGPEIREQMGAGRIEIDPFNPKHVNPASVDLTLGGNVTLYEGTFKLPKQPAKVDDGRDWHALPELLKRSPDVVWDTRVPWPTITKTIDPEVGWVLKPGLCYLLHTAERIHTKHYVPIIDGKSSIGRAFILVHYTAGYGDPGFNGQFTLEVTTQIPVRVFPGMRFCQVRFHTLVGDVLLYKGHYTGENARGAVGSRLSASGYDTRPVAPVDDGDLARELLDALEI